MILCLLTFFLGVVASASYNIFAVFWVSAVLSFVYAFMTISVGDGFQLADLFVIGLAALFQVGYLVGGLVLPLVPKWHVARLR